MNNLEGGGMEGGAGARHDGAEKGADTVVGVGYEWKGRGGA